jgi:hypothetical protein
MLLCLVHKLCSIFSVVLQATFFTTLCLAFINRICLYSVFMAVFSWTIFYRQEFSNESRRLKIGIHRIYPNVGCVGLTKTNREVGIVFRFFPECIRMSVLCFSRILSNHFELDWIRLKLLNIFNQKIIYIQSLCVHTYIDLNLN